MQRFLSCMWSSSMTLVIQSFSGLYVFRSGGGNGLKQGLQIFFPVKSQIVNVFSLVFHVVGTTTQLCHYSTETSTGNMYMSVGGCALVKAYGSWWWAGLGHLSVVCWSLCSL